MIEDEDIKLLVADWQEGDDSAFAELYELFVDKVYRYVFFKVAHSHAEDLVEQAFIKAWEARATYDPAKSSFSTWLFTVARNLVIDHYRRHKEDVSLHDVADVLTDDKQLTPRQHTERELDTENLRLALEYVEEPYREVVILRYLEDFSYQEIGDLLGKTEGAVRVMAFRGLKKLKEIMSDLGISL